MRLKKNLNLRVSGFVISYYLNSYCIIFFDALPHHIFSTMSFSSSSYLDHKESKDPAPPSYENVMDKSKDESYVKVDILSSNSTTCARLSSLRSFEGTSIRTPMDLILVVDISWFDDVCCELDGGKEAALPGSISSGMPSM